LFFKSGKLDKRFDAHNTRILSGPQAREFGFLVFVEVGGVSMGGGVI